MHAGNLRSPGQTASNPDRPRPPRRPRAEFLAAAFGGGIPALIGWATTTYFVGLVSGELHLAATEDPPYLLRLAFSWAMISSAVNCENCPRSACSIPSATSRLNSSISS